MSSPRVLCLWAGCAASAPSEQALFQHLCATHAGADDDRVFLPGNKGCVPHALACHWDGCTHTLYCYRNTHAQPCAIESHLLQHTEYTPYKCVVAGCGRAFQLQDWLRAHRDTFHNAGTLLDFVGAYVSSSPEPASRDASPAQPRIIEENRLSAKLCACEWVDCVAGGFSDGAALNKHIVDSHVTTQDKTIKTVTCGWRACDRTMPRRGRYIEHFRTHLPKDYKPFICDVCPERFALQFQLGRHRKAVHCDEQLDEDEFSEPLSSLPSTDPRRKRSIDDVVSVPVTGLKRRCVQGSLAKTPPDDAARQKPELSLANSPRQHSRDSDSEQEYSPSSAVFPMQLAPAGYASFPDSQSVEPASMDGALLSRIDPALLEISDF